MKERTPAAPLADPTDLRAVLQQQRQLGGTCALCGTSLTRRTAARHLDACAPKHDAARGPQQHLVRLRVTAPGLPAYWLDVEVRDDARLTALDNVLRGVWLECCGHLSSFHSGEIDYFSAGYDLRESAAMWSPFGTRRTERSMNVRMDRVLPAVGERFAYEYDFGTTTRLSVQVTGARVGTIGRAPVRLLARNDAPVWPCATCGQQATVICTYCAGTGDQPFACDAHRTAHDCSEAGDESWLPVVNSPRMGVCGYVG